MLDALSGCVPFSAGDTFLMAGTGGAANPSGAHLMACIILNKPDDRCTVVPVTSRHEFSDTSCCIAVGDHPWIRHDSVASYEFARILSISSVEAELAAGTLKARAPLGPELLKRLQIGFVVSDETAPYIFTQANGPKLELYLRHKGYI